MARIPVDNSADEMPDKVLGAHSHGLEVATANQLRLTALRFGSSSRQTAAERSSSVGRHKVAPDWP